MLGIFISPDGTGYDLARNATTGHLETDASLRTTVLCLLFTEGRLNPEDVQTGEPRGGWWGNSYPDVQGWEIGGRLYFVATGKATAVTIQLIEEAIRKQLQCLIDDGIVESLAVEIGRRGQDGWNCALGLKRRDSQVSQWIDFWVNSL